MVAIVDPKDEIDLDILAEGIDKNLPMYARPLFLRILPELQLTGMCPLSVPKRLDHAALGLTRLFFFFAFFLFFTGTYKVMKTNLKNEGFDPQAIQDKLYFKHSVKGFLPINESLYNDIITGAIKI